MEQKAPRQKVEIDWGALRERLARAMLELDQSDPAGERRVLDERARRLARRPSAESSAERLELLCFSLAEERYAIEVRYAFEVLRLEQLARLPGAPEYMLGVTSLRGEILPVFDIRVLLGVARVGLCDMSRLIVLGGASREFGILADAVHELSTLDAEAVLEPAASIAGLGRKYLRGITADALIVLDGRTMLEDQTLFIADAGHAPDETR